jgi:hypothetical protein
MLAWLRHAVYALEPNHAALDDEVEPGRAPMPRDRSR